MAKINFINIQRDFWLFTLFLNPGEVYRCKLQASIKTLLFNSLLLYSPHFIADFLKQS